MNDLETKQAIAKSLGNFPNKPLAEFDREGKTAKYFPEAAPTKRRCWIAMRPFG